MLKQLEVDLLRHSSFKAFPSDRVEDSITVVQLQFWQNQRSRDYFSSLMWNVLAFEKGNRGRLSINGGISISKGHPVVSQWRLDGRSRNNSL